jgi:hypothetical protein
MSTARRDIASRPQLGGVEGMWIGEDGIPGLIPRNAVLIAEVMFLEERRS